MWAAEDGNPSLNKPFITFLLCASKKKKKVNILQALACLLFKCGPCYTVNFTPQIPTAATGVPHTKIRHLLLNSSVFLSG